MANDKTKDNGKEYVLKMAKENDVKFIKLWFTDILGFLKSFAITCVQAECAIKAYNFIVVEQGLELTAN